MYPFNIKLYTLVQETAANYNKMYICIFVTNYVPMFKSQLFSQILLLDCSDSVGQ